MLKYIGQFLFLFFYFLCSFLNNQLKINSSGVNMSGVNLSYFKVSRPGKKQFYIKTFLVKFTLLSDEFFLSF